MLHTCQHSRSTRARIRHAAHAACARDTGISAAARTHHRASTGQDPPVTPRAYLHFWARPRRHTRRHVLRSRRHRSPAPCFGVLALALPSLVHRCLLHGLREAGPRTRPCTRARMCSQCRRGLSACAASL
eukprot:6924494-Alexandrium_andersonii.AAC.1